MSVLVLKVYPAAFSFAAVVAARPVAPAAFSTAMRTADGDPQCGDALAEGDGEGLAWCEPDGDGLGLAGVAGPPALGNALAITTAPTTTAATRIAPLITPVFTASPPDPSRSWRRHLAPAPTTTTNRPGGDVRSGSVAWPPGAA